MRNHTESDHKRRLTYFLRNCHSVETENETQTTILSSTSSPASGRETPDQQRGIGTSTFFAGTTAYTQYGVAETFGPERRRSSADQPSNTPSSERHDLRREGSQVPGSGSMQYEPHTTRIEEPLACPYHRHVLQERPTTACSGQGQGPMDRYLAEGPSERYAILHQPGTGSTSTPNGCRCLEVMQSNIETNGHAQK